MCQVFGQIRGEGQQVQTYILKPFPPLLRAPNPLGPEVRAGIWRLNWEDPGVCFGIKVWTGKVVFIVVV